MNDKNFKVSKILKALSKITIKRALRVCLKIIIKSVYTISNTWNFLFFKHYKYYKKNFIKSLSNALLKSVW